MACPRRERWIPAFSGMTAGGCGNDVVVMRRDISLFCRQTGPGRLGTWSSQLCETVSAGVEMHPVTAHTNMGMNEWVGER